MEQPGSNPVVFEAGGPIASVLEHWPKEQIVKCLVFYHPDDPAPRRQAQENQMRILSEAATSSGHELLLELIPTTHATPATSASHMPENGDGDDSVIRAMTRFYDIGIHPDWWKLPPQSAKHWQRIDALIAQRDPYSQGVVMLGLNASLERLTDAFAEARHSRSCRGFAVGRSIFRAPARDWLGGNIDDGELVQRCCESFERLIRAWLEVRATSRP